MKAPSRIVSLTTDTFDAVALASDRPVLVEFVAPWCGACRAAAPTVEALAADFAGRAVVASLDVDAHPEVAARFGIRSLPTFILFDGGVAVDGVIGAAPRAVLADRIDARLQRRGDGRGAVLNGHR